MSRDFLSIHIINLYLILLHTLPKKNGKGLLDLRRGGGSAVTWMLNEEMRDAFPNHAFACREAEIRLYEETSRLL